MYYFILLNTYYASIKLLLILHAYLVDNYTCECINLYTHTRIYNKYIIFINILMRDIYYYEYN